MSFPCKMNLKLLQISALIHAGSITLLDVTFQFPTFLMSSRDSPFIMLLSLGAEDSGPALRGPELAWAEFCRSCWYLSISGFSMMVVES